MRQPDDLIPKPIRLFNRRWWLALINRLSTEYVSHIEEGKGVKVTRTRGTPHAVRVQADPAAIRNIIFGSSAGAESNTPQLLTYVADVQINTSDPSIEVRYNTATVIVQSVATGDWTDIHTFTTCA